jgi:hypothetical protein
MTRHVRSTRVYNEDMTTTTRPELKPALDRHGRQMSADGGAAKNELRPMKECTGCGNFVAFVQNKADKWYLANCYRYANQSHEGHYYYRKDSLHKCPGKQTVPVVKTEADRLKDRIAECEKELAAPGNLTAEQIDFWTRRLAFVTELLAEAQA